MPQSLAALLAAQDVTSASGASALTRADKDSLETGTWADDFRNVTPGRIYYVDLPLGVKQYTTGFGKHDRETLRVDALSWLWESDGRVGCACGHCKPITGLPIGPAHSGPTKREWLTRGGTHGLTRGAWRAMEAALAHAANHPGVGRTPRHEIPTDFWQDGHASLADEEQARQYETEPSYSYERQWDDAREIAAMMGLGRNAQRVLQRAACGWSDATCAREWNVSATSLETLLKRGRAELAKRFPPATTSAHDIADELNAARAVLIAAREESARHACIEYNARPTTEAELEARDACQSLTDARGPMTMEKRTLIASLTRRLASGNIADPDVLVSAERLAVSIPRQVRAEALREADNVRKGHRGILAGSVAPATSAPLPPAIARQWKNGGEDSEVRANRLAVEARNAERFRRAWLATLCQHSLAACLVAMHVRETDKQRWHETQHSLAVSQALDASYSAAFKIKPSAHGRALLLADARMVSEMDTRRAAIEKARLENARQERMKNR